MIAFSVFECIRTYFPLLTTVKVAIVSTTVSALKQNKQTINTVPAFPVTFVVAARSHTETDRQTDRLTDRLTIRRRQRDTETQTQRQRQRDTETQRHRDIETQRHRDTET